MKRNIQAYPLTAFLRKGGLRSNFTKCLNSIINNIKNSNSPSLLGKVGMGILFFLISSCANKVAISGGVKDETPPKIEFTFPNTGAINYKANSIVLKFDEYVKLNNFQTEFISSPPLKTLPDYHIKRKSIVLKIDNPLIDSTTYILDFGNSIQDITEGNTLKNYQFAFSTGPSIDSLKLSGKIKNAFDLKPEKDIAIMLFKNLNDSAPKKTIPNYYTKSNDDGSFTLTHVKEGKYQIFALVDANSNYMFDLGTEKIAFSDSMVIAGKSDSISLYLFQEENARLHKNKISNDEYGKLLFVFNLPADSAHITPLNKNLPTNWKIEEWSAKHDSLTYWLPDSVIDTLKLQIVTDTIIDTAYIALVQKPVLNSNSNKKNRRTKPFKLSIASNINSAAFDLNKDISIHFSHPIKTSNFSTIILVSDSDTLKPSITFCDSLHRHLSIKYRWKEEKSYSLFILDSTFTDIFNLCNDTLKYAFKTKSLKQYGTAVLNVSFADSIQNNFIIQLLNEKGNVLRENYMSKSGKITYNYMDAGSYYLKAIRDTNKNKKWDTGNFDKHLLPEKVLSNPTPLSIRANWDIDVDWKLTE